MEVIVIFSLIAILILCLLFVYTVGIFKEIYCDKKDFYIKTLEDEIAILEDYIERNEVIQNDL